MNNIKKFGAVCGEFKDVADFITIYIAEAHPFDSGDLADEYKHKYNTHIQMEDRIKVRNLFFFCSQPLKFWYSLDPSLSQTIMKR